MIKRIIILGGLTACMGMVITGIVLCLTLVGAIIGIPLILIGCWWAGTLKKQVEELNKKKEI